MKRLSIVLLIAINAYIAFNQYLSYRRYNPPTNYHYPIAPEDSIDVHYHRPEAVTEYYRVANEAGVFARKVWFNDGIDVLFPDERDEQSLMASTYYNQLISQARELEARLRASKKLKKAKYDNEAIAFIEEKGIAQDEYMMYKAVQERPLSKGDTSAVVWKVQGILIKLGYDIPHDGLFIEITEDAVKKFQKSRKLLASGKVDEMTMRELLKHQ